MIDPINFVYIPTRHYPVGLCNGEAVCLLWCGDCWIPVRVQKIHWWTVAPILENREHPRLWILTAQKAVYLSAFLVPLCTRSASVCSSSELLTPCPLDYSSEAVTYPYMSSSGWNVSDKWYGLTKIYSVLL